MWLPPRELRGGADRCNTIYINFTAVRMKKISSYICLGRGGHKILPQIKGSHLCHSFFSPKVPTMYLGIYETKILFCIFFYIKSLKLQKCIYFTFFFYEWQTIPGKFLNFYKFVFKFLGNILKSFSFFFYFSLNWIKIWNFIHLHFCFCLFLTDTF